MKYTVVDVRTRVEYEQGHVPGSINIPLNEVVEREAEVIALPESILFCCLSGGRSGQATAYFQGKGLDCENGGGWLEVKYRLESGEN